MVTKASLEKLRDQPGIFFPQGNDPYSDEFVPPVVTSMAGDYHAIQPQQKSYGLAAPLGSQLGTQGAGREQQPLSAEEMHRRFVEDIMGEEASSAPTAVEAAAAGANQSSGAAVGAGGGGQMGSGGAGGHFLMRSGKSFGASRAAALSRGERSVSASAAPSDTAQVCLLLL